MSMPEFNPQEQRLIDQLRQGPAPQLGLVQVSSLRERILAEVDVVWEIPQAPGSSNALPGKLWPWIMGILVIIAGISLLLGVLSRMTDEDVVQGETFSAPTEQMLETPIIAPTPTATSTSTPTDAPTAMMTPQASPTENLTATTAPTLALTETAPAPTATLTATQTLVTPQISQDESVIVIEGQVSEVGQNYIVIFDMWIELGDSSDFGFQPRSGIIVRVEGTPRLEPDRMVIQAISITMIQPAQSPGPAGQPGAPPPPPPPPSRPDSSRSSRSS